MMQRFRPLLLRHTHARDDAMAACRAALAPYRGDETVPQDWIGLRRACRHRPKGRPIYDPMVEVIRFGADWPGGVPPEDMTPQERARVGEAAWLSQYGCHDALVARAINRMIGTGWEKDFSLDWVILRDMLVVTPRDLFDLSDRGAGETPDPRIGVIVLPDPVSAHQEVDQLSRLPHATHFLRRWHGNETLEILPPKISRQE